MVYDTKIITDYITLLNKVVELFVSKKIKQLHYAKILGKDRVTFKKRIDDKSFTPEELLKIVEEINREFN